LIFKHLEELSDGKLSLKTEEETLSEPSGLVRNNNSNNKKYKKNYRNKGRKRQRK
jgi:hypothetical protein